MGGFLLPNLYHLEILNICLFEWETTILDRLIGLYCSDSLCLLALLGLDGFITCPNKSVPSEFRMRRQHHHGVDTDFRLYFC